MPEARPLRVLIADDDAALRFDLKEKLAGCGYEVETANDGLDALLRIEAAPPDLLVLDMLLPHVDGLRVLRALRARDDMREVKVVVVSARDDAATLIDVRTQGVGAYLTKPCSVAEILGVVTRLLPPQR